MTYTRELLHQRFLQGDCPAPPPWLNKCRASCTTVADHIWMFIMEENTLNITSTNPMPLNYPSHFGRSAIFSHVIYSGIRPSWNSTWVIITRVSHRRVIRHFSRASSWSQAFRWSKCIPDDKPYLPVKGTLTSTTFFSPPSGLYIITFGPTRIGIGLHSGGHCL